MADLIDRAALIDFTNARYNKTLILADVVDFPTVDAVEVVRCKDCEEWNRHCGVIDSPNGHCSHLEITTNGYDYCSYGERRTDATD